MVYFNELVGNAVTLSLIKRTLANKTFNHVTLFHGSHGTGKSTAAKNVALALTCENPHNGEPCGECVACRSNLNAFETTGQSRNVKIVNCGMILDKKDVAQFIQEVFVLEAATGNQVYILEEVHALKDVNGAYTSLLAEIDKIPPNVYLILCTTKPTALDAALRSRCLQFTFNRLTAADSRLLLQREARKLGYTDIQPAILELLITSSRGVPRELRKGLEFVIDSGASLEELQSFLGQISTGTFIHLFNTMKNAEMAAYTETVDNLTSSFSAEAIVSGLKDFILDSIFRLESADVDVFSKPDAEAVKSLFNFDLLMKIAQILEKLDYRSDNNDIQFALLRIRQLMQGRSFVNVVTEQKQIAAKEKVIASNLAHEVIDASQAALKPKLTALDLKTLNAFNGGV